MKVGVLFTYGECLRGRVVSLRLLWPLHVLMKCTCQIKKVNAYVCWGFDCDSFYDFNIWFWIVPVMLYILFFILLGMLIHSFSCFLYKRSLSMYYSFNSLDFKNHCVHFSYLFSLHVYIIIRRGTCRSTDVEQVSVCW